MKESEHDVFAAIELSRRLESNPRANACGSQGMAGIEPLEDRIAPAGTGVIYVNTLSDHNIVNKTTLANAIATANTAGTPYVIDFIHGLKGTITLSSTLNITGNVTINGAGITLNGALKVQDIAISGGGSVMLNGLRISKGNATPSGIGGGIYINDAGGTVTLSQCIVSGNHATGARGVAGNIVTNSGTPGSYGEGGGIAIMAGTVSIQGSTISGNVAVGGAGGAGGYNGGNAEGGGIFNQGTLTLINSHITGNTATGGAGTVGFNGAAYSVAVSGPLVAANGGQGGSAYGGGIANSGGTVIVENTAKNISIISGNTVKGGAGAKGGATYNGANGTNFAVVAGSPANPTAGYNGGYGGSGGNGGNAAGGGICSTGGSVTITSSTVSGNVVFAGAGGSGTNGGHGGKGGNGGHYAGSTYYGYAGGVGGNGGDAGSAGFASGGGLFTKDALTIQASTVSGNIVHVGAAGIAGHAGAAGANGTLYQGGVQASGKPGKAANITPSAGGGFYIGGGTLSVSISTIAKNSAQDGGGGNISQSTTASIYSSTFALNAATLSGGGLYVASGNIGSLDVVSTIIAQNVASNVSGTSAAIMTDDITSGTVLSTHFALHSGGFTDTLLPLLSLAEVANNGTNNPIPLLTDQNGVAFGSTMMEIGAVQTPA
jgi:hypothetical protein